MVLRLDIFMHQFVQQTLGFLLPLENCIRNPNPGNHCGPLCQGVPLFISMSASFLEFACMVVRQDWLLQGWEIRDAGEHDCAPLPEDKFHGRLLCHSHRSLGEQLLVYCYCCLCLTLKENQMKEIKQERLSILFSTLVAPYAILSLLQPLNHYRAPSAIESAIGRPYLALPRIHAQAGAVNRLILNRFGGSTAR